MVIENGCKMLHWETRHDTVSAEWNCGTGNAGKENTKRPLLFVCSLLQASIAQL